MLERLWRECLHRYPPSTISASALPRIRPCPGSLVKVQCCLCSLTMARSKDRVLFFFSSL